MGDQGIKLGFEALRFPLSRDIAQDVKATQVGIGGTGYRRRSDGQFSILRFLLDYQRHVAALLVRGILRQLRLKSRYIDEKCLPPGSQISKGHSHHFFSRHGKELAKWTIDGIHLPAGRNENIGLAGSIENGPALALSALYQGILSFEGVHGL